VPEVRVIGEEGEQMGVMDVRDAIRSARERGLDLVEVAPNADPPVCRIIDFGKFQYEAKKKANEAKKKQVTITVKEVKFRPGTDVHDYEYRMKHAREWLGDGDKVKATIWFRGREMTHRELGARILEKLEQDLADVAKTKNSKGCGEEISNDRHRQGEARSFACASHSYQEDKQA
jgi:translation initiation factor IF-3